MARTPAERQRDWRRRKRREIVSVDRLDVPRRVRDVLVDLEYLPADKRDDKDAVRDALKAFLPTLRSAIIS